MKSFDYIFDKTIILAIKQLVRVIAYLWPRDKKLVAFGAWYGKMYNDNPKYFLEHLLANTDFKAVWIGDEVIREKLPKSNRVRFVRKDSLAAAFALLRAKTWIFCISIEWDLTTWPLEGFATLVNTWHGYSFKRNGAMTASERGAPRATLSGRIVRRLGLHTRPWLMIGGERDAEKLLAGDPLYFRKDRILRIGTPTNDYLIKGDQDESLKRSLREKYAKIIGFDPAQEIITYLPTWRTDPAQLFSFYSLPEGEQKKFASILHAHNAVLIEKHHYRTLEAMPIVGESTCSIPISAEKQKLIDTNELLLISDILISDYSGTYQDFGVLKRPCIHFVYDLENYCAMSSGLVDGFENMYAGPAVNDIDTLTNELEKTLQQPRFIPASGFADTCKYQTGHACEQLLEFIRK